MSDTTPDGGAAPDPGLPRERESVQVAPLALRDNLDASLALPRDLTADEAERLATFIRALVHP